MNNEQNLLKKWRSLPEDQQQEVIDFVDFLATRIKLLKSLNLPDQTAPNTAIAEKVVTSKPLSLSSLGIKLQQIRAKIVASGVPLLSAEDIEVEKAKRRGGYQEAE